MSDASYLPTVKRSTSRYVRSKIDNARPLRTTGTEEKIQDFRRELFDYFFLHFEQRLGGRRFENDGELKNAVVNRSSTLGRRVSMENGLKKPCSATVRKEKCLEMYGGYVEK